MPRVGALLIGVLSSGLVLQILQAMLTAPVIDDPAHLAAGCAILTRGDTNLYKVNTPLVRSIAALPVTWMNPAYDWSSLSERAEVRSEWETGRRFATANAARFRTMMNVARLALLPFWLLGTLCVIRWSTTLGGHWSGFAACVMWVCNPNVVAWTATLAADCSSACAGVCAAYLTRTSWRSWRPPDGILAGAVTGVAILAKSTWLVVLPVLVLLGFLVVRPEKSPGVGCCLFGLWGVSALVVINAGYQFDRAFERLGSFSLLQ